MREEREEQGLLSHTVLLTGQVTVLLSALVSPSGDKVPPPKGFCGMQ